MALLVNLYSDWMCTNPAKNISLGVAGVTGQYAQLNQWQQRGTYIPTIEGNTYYFYQLNAFDNMGFTLGGGSTIYDYDFTSQIPFYTSVPTDRDNQNSGTLIYNPMFTGRGGIFQGTTVAFALSLCDFDNPNYQGTKYFTIRMYSYSQVPDSGTRTSWNYRNSYMMFEVNAPMPANTAYPLIKLFQITIENKKFYMLACGVSGSNALHPAGSYQPTTLFLIPEIYFKDQPNVPYIGPVSKESADTAYIGNPAGTDTISSRDLSTLKNPFGFNSGGTMFLSEITSTVYHNIVSGIYDGTSGSPLNALGQVVSGLVGGNTHRPAEEIEAMIKGVLCCHIVPTITTYTTGSPVAIYTISGYQINNTALAANAVNQICTVETAAFAVKRINGSFLDFEPYTTVDLIVPFLGTVRIPASVIMDKAVKIRFAIDLLSGTLSADIIIVETGRTWIYTTLQGNCALDMPIMGAGANANPLLKIASAAGGIATGGILGAAAGVFNIIDGAASAAFSQPVGKCNLTNIGAFLSPRNIAMIIHTPSPSNAQYFGVIVGTPSNMSGKVGDFSGYTEFADIDLSSVVGATDSELSEIETFLKGGCFV